MRKRNTLAKVKQNINFLDRPMFIPSRKIANVGSYTDHSGFTIETHSNKGLPSMFDKQLLYVLMSVAQSKDDNHIQLKSIRDLIKMMSLPFNGKTLRRVKESLDKWAKTTLLFEKDMFYRKSRIGKRLIFNVIHEVYIKDYDEDDDYIHIILSNRFMNQHEKDFVKLVDLHTMLKFENPFAMRLYEILAKQFLDSNMWKIGMKKLFSKVGSNIRRRYGALEQLELGVKEINKKVGDKFLRLSFTVNKDDVVTFTL